MKHFFKPLRLVVCLLLCLVGGSGNVWGTTEVTSSNISTAMVNGAYITLQCLDTNGGDGYYFNGATTKSTTLSYANFFKIVSNSSGAYYLQRVSDGKYVGNSNNAISMLDASTSAAAFTFSIATIGNDWSKTGNTKGSAAKDGVNSVRFTNGSVYLNTQDKGGTPKYTNGTGGYSVWQVYTYTEDEVEAYNPTKTISYTLTDAANNTYTGTYSAEWNDDNTSLPTITGCTGAVVGGNTKTFTKNGSTYSLAADITFPFPVSKTGGKTNRTCISSYTGGTFNWYAKGTDICVKKEASVTDAFAWAIYPSMTTPGAFTFTIKNISANKFLYSTSTTSSHNQGTVTLDATGSALTYESVSYTKGTQSKTANAWKLSSVYLSVNSSTTSDEQYVGTYTAGHDGVNVTFPEYNDILFSTTGAAHPFRIPALTQLKNNNLLALGDYRWSGADIGQSTTNNGRVDIVGRISTDYGATWGTQATVAQGLGDGSNFSGYGDAALVTDRESGKVLLMCCNASGSQLWNSGNQGSSRWISEDNGATWTRTTTWDGTAKTNITGSTGWFFTSGRICQSKYIKKGDYYRIYSAICSTSTSNSSDSYVLYSDDFGATWNVLGGKGTVAVAGGNESKVEELPDGRVLISARLYNGTTSGNIGRGFNIFTYTDSESATGSWGTKATAELGNDGQGTNGEILIVPAKDASNNDVYVALQSLPIGDTSSKTNRALASVYYKVLDAYANFNDPTTFASGWTKSVQLSSTSSAYTTMALQNDGNIGIYYEDALKNDGYNLVYKKFSLSELTEQKYTHTTNTTLNRKTFLTKYFNAMKAANTTWTDGQKTVFDGLVAAMSDEPTQAQMDAIYTFVAKPYGISRTVKVINNASKGNVTVTWGSNSETIGEEGYKEVTTSEDVTVTSESTGQTYAWSGWTFGDGTSITTENSYTYTGTTDVILQANWSKSSTGANVTYNNTTGNTYCFSHYIFKNANGETKANETNGNISWTFSGTPAFTVGMDISGISESIYNANYFLAYYSAGLYLKTQGAASRRFVISSDEYKITGYTATYKSASSSYTTTLTADNGTTGGAASNTSEQTLTVSGLNTNETGFTFSGSSTQYMNCILTSLNITYAIPTSLAVAVISTVDGGTAAFSDGTTKKTLDGGDQVTVVATPADNTYSFVKWTDADGNELSTDATYTFTVSKDITLTPVFGPRTYTWTLNVAEGGTGEVKYMNTSFEYVTTSVTSTSETKDVTFNYGDLPYKTVNLNIYPATGKEISTFTVDGEDKTSSLSVSQDGSYMTYPWVNATTPFDDATFVITFKSIEEGGKATPTTTEMSSTYLNYLNSSTTLTSIDFTNATGTTVSGLDMTNHPNCLVYVNKGTTVSGISNNVVEKDGDTYTCSSLVLTDGLGALHVPTAFTASKVSYERDNSSTLKWGTVMLPYAPQTSETTVYYELTSQDGSTLKFTKVDEPKANIPYLYKNTSGANYTAAQSTSISVKETSYSDAEKYITGGEANYVMKGVFLPSSISDGTSEGYTGAADNYPNVITDKNSLYIKSGSFWKINKRFTLKPFRAFITTSSSDGARFSNMTISIDEDTPTGVEFIESEDGKTVDVIYDINGARLQQMKNGINIVNGKKVIR